MAWDQWLIIAGFHVFIIAMLALDLGLFQPKDRAVSTRKAAIWSAIWISLALAFALVGIRHFWHLWDPLANPQDGAHKSLEFVTGYLVELSLSVDNLFVFLVIFRFFAVPDHLRHRVLAWGIIGAVILRATFIISGAALLRHFSWMIYIFAAILLYTAYKLFHSVEEEIDPSRNRVLRLAQRFLPVVHDYDSSTFWVRREGKWHATPLPLVLLVVETTDVMFAFDSIPAIFGITRDPFIVYTSNIFAVLGLRSLYFLLANFLGRFRYLTTGLSVILAFVGLKMIVEELVGKEQLEAWGFGETEKIIISLGVVSGILALAVLASIWAGPKEPVEHPPEAVSETPPAEAQNNVQ